jgi:hypothetical protein
MAFFFTFSWAKLKIGYFSGFECKSKETLRMRQVLFYLFCDEVPGKMPQN